MEYEPQKKPEDTPTIEVGATADEVNITPEQQEAIQRDKIMREAAEAERKAKEAYGNKGPFWVEKD